MLRALSNRPTLYMASLVLLALCFCTDIIPVSIMEARNFISAREMIVDGHWLLTTMNGEARYEKPPLPTWITAAFGLVFGIKNLLALRLPAVLFVALIGIFTYRFSQTLLFNRYQSSINGLIVVTSFYVVGITLEAPWDIYAHGFMLMGIYHLFQWFKKDAVFSVHVVWAAVFIGCSILCKGPIPIYALLLPFLLAYGFTYRFRGFKPKLVWAIGCLVVALVVGGWWYVYVRMNDPHTFEAIATREANNWHSYNTKPFYYYWSFFTQSGLWTIPALISLMYPYLKSRVSDAKAYRFSWLWTILAVILLSLVPEKKSRYLMPVLIPLAINTGFYIEYLIRSFKSLRNPKETLPVYFNFGLIALIAIAFPVALYVFVGEGILNNPVRFAITAIVTVGLGILMCIHLKRKHMEALVLLSVAFFVAIFLVALPLLKPIVGTANNPINTLGHDALKMYGIHSVSPEMIWHYGAKIPPIKRADGTFDFPQEPSFGVLGTNLGPKDWDILKAHYKVQKMEPFDLNTVPPGSKRHNDRLVNDFYILTER